MLYHGDCLQVLSTIESGCIDTVLIDPPYVRTLPVSWDRLSDQDATEFFSAVLEQSARVLRYGGRFISFASNDTLKYLYQGSLKHRELLVIDKGAENVSAGRNTRQYRQHINQCEYVFIATKDAREHTRRLLTESAAGRSAKEMNEILGAASDGGGLWSIYTGDNICGQVPTKEHWDILRKELGNLPAYETFGETFHNGIGMGNILTGFDFRIKDRVHPAQKPLSLVEYLLGVYTNSGDTVMDFVMGSGTTGVACVRNDREFIGIESDAEYFEAAARRIEQARMQPKLF